MPEEEPEPEEMMEEEQINEEMEKEEIEEEEESVNEEAHEQEQVQAEEQVTEQGALRAEEKGTQVIESYASEEMRGEEADLYEQSEVKIRFPDIPDVTPSTASTQDVVFDPEVRSFVLR